MSGRSKAQKEALKKAKETIESFAPENKEWASGQPEAEVSFGTAGDFSTHTCEYVIPVVTENVRTVIKDGDSWRGIKEVKKLACRCGQERERG
jgi:hypothetical protein